MESFNGLKVSEFQWLVNALISAVRLSMTKSHLKETIYIHEGESIGQVVRYCNNGNPLKNE